MPDEACAYIFKFASRFESYLHNPLRKTLCRWNTRTEYFLRKISSNSLEMIPDEKKVQIKWNEMFRE